MANMSDYLETQLAQSLFGTTDYTWPTNIYLALFTSVPTDTGGTEVSGGSYARVNITALGAWTIANGQASNAVAHAFPTPTATWGTIQGFGIYDASTSGNLLIYGSLSVARTVSLGDGPPQFSAGSLVVTFL
jgi:hypothetical protein